SAAFENVAEFTFKSDQAGVEQFPSLHDHDVESRGEFVPCEPLGDQPFGPVPHHGAAQFPGSGYAQSAGFKAVGEPEQRERPAVNLETAVVNLLILRPSANALAAVETGHHRRLPHGAPMRQTKHLLAADGQTLPALGAAALQHETAILGGHTDQEPVRLAAPACIRL